MVNRMRRAGIVVDIAPPGRRPGHCPSHPVNPSSRPTRTAPSDRIPLPAPLSRVWPWTHGTADALAAIDRPGAPPLNFVLTALFTHTDVWGGAEREGSRVSVRTTVCPSIDPDNSL